MTMARSRPVHPAITTRLTTLLKCQYPILLPGMSWISTPQLVAAVTNAGGVGILATGPLSADETRQSIQEIRSLLKYPTRQTFGIGATLLMPGAAENAQVALEEQVPLINVSLGKADWIADAIHKYNGTLLSTVTNTKHAMAALESGADALMVTGHEAAAHGGDVTSLVIIPTLAQQFPQIPIVAAGGFATGRGLAAALTLGADGVAMGSRMAISQESPLAQTVKEAVVAASEVDTIYGKNLDGIPARVLKTSQSQHLMQHKPNLLTITYRAIQAARDMNIPLWKVLPGLITQYDKMFVIAQFGAATQALKAATIHGDLNDGVQFIGQCQGLINSIQSVEELIQDIVYEANEVSTAQAEVFASR